jgi:hypothetical protein
MGCDNPGAARVRTLLLYWPADEGAWTVRVSTVVPGTTSPTLTVCADTETAVEAPPLTDSVQEMKVNW